MKFFIVFAVLFVVGVQSQLDDKKVLNEDGYKACALENNVDNETALKIRNGDTSFTDMNSQCFLKCIFTKAKLWSEKEDISTIVANEILLKNLSKEEIEKVKSIIQMCKAEKGANSCETAYKIFKCYVDHRTKP